jgi:hypothetical protein
MRHKRIIGCGIAMAIPFVLVYVWLNTTIILTSFIFNITPKHYYVPFSEGYYQTVVDKILLIIGCFFAWLKYKE